MKINLGSTFVVIALLAQLAHADAHLFASFVGNYTIIDSKCYYNDDNSPVDGYALDQFSVALQDPNTVEFAYHYPGSNLKKVEQDAEWKGEASWGRGEGKFLSSAEYDAIYTETDDITDQTPNNIYKRTLGLKHSRETVIFDQEFSDTPPPSPAYRYYHCHSILQLK